MIGYINMLAIRSLDGIVKPCDEIIRTTHSFRESEKPLHTTRQSAYLMCPRQAQYTRKLKLELV